MTGPSRFALLAVVLIGGLALTACTTPPPQNRFPEITFRHLPQIKLDVREISVEDEYRAPGVAPNVDHLFPVRPAVTAMAWGRDRLVAAGSTRRMRYIVRDASVVETSLKKKEGLTSVLTIDQSERYALRIAVEMQIIGDDGRTEATANGQVERTITVPEDIKLADREKAWFKMVDEAMKELDAQLEKTVKSVFFPYLIQ